MVKGESENRGYILPQWHLCRKPVFFANSCNSCNGRRCIYGLRRPFIFLCTCLHTTLVLAKKRRGDLLRKRLSTLAVCKHFRFTLVSQPLFTSTSSHLHTFLPLSLRLLLLPYLPVVSVEANHSFEGFDQIYKNLSDSSQFDPKRYRSNVRYVTLR